ncbi:MAG: hypothetical protein C1943_04995 [Halochromatium sp.]|nr:hypothetical protein [Halochromatium sp.]
MSTSFPFRVHITTLLVVIVVASCLLLATFTYYANKQLAEERAEQQIDGLINRLNDRVEQLMSAPRAITRVVSRQAGPLSLVRARDLDARMTSVPFLAEMIKEAGHVGSIYIGYPNGDFFMVRQIDPDEPLAGAAPKTRWLVRTVADDAAGGRTLTLFQLDRDFSVLQRNSGPTDYDPRQRPWYQQARDSAEGIRTDPLLLANDQELGIIYAHPAPVAEDERLRRLAAGSTDLTAAVIGASVQLDSLSRVIARTKVTSGSEVVVFDSRGLLVAYEDPSKLLAPGPGGASSRRASLGDIGSPVVDEVAQQWLERRSDESLGFVSTAAGDTWSSRVVPLEVHSGPPLYLGVSVPESELYASVATIRNQTLAIALGFLVLMVPVMLAVSSAFARPIVRLNQEAVAIRRFDFAETPAVPSRITEIHDLSQSMGEMKSTIRRFIEINLALGSETNFEQLLSDLLRETIQAAKAGSGALYLTDQEEHLVLHLKGLMDDQAWQLLPSERVLEAPDVVQEAVLARDVVVRAIERQALDALGLSDLVLEGQGGSLHTIALPLSNRQGQVAGAMLLLSRTHPEPGLVDFVSALSASSTISLETRELIEAQKRLFEALIKLIADAIDAKSPYTGGHCARVPELTKLLAQAADAA